MLDNIIHFALRNRLAVIFSAVLLIITGLYTVQQTEVDVFPDLNAPTVVVMTEAGGMAPEEVERLVTFPIETAVNGATGVRRVRSSSTTGFSVVWVEFDWDTEIYRDRQIVSEKLAAIAGMLPEGVGKPTLGPQSSIMGEVMFVAITADSTSLRDLRTLADWTLRPRLLATGGVAQVAVIGGELKEYQILLSPERMRHYGVSLIDVTEAVGDMNRNVSGGILYEYGQEYIIRGVLATTDLQTLREAVVRTGDGRTIPLSQVADVKIGNHSPMTGVASVKGQPAVIMTVTKQPSTSTIDLSERIDATLAELQSRLPADVKMHTDIYRQEHFIHSAINNVQKSILEGGIFVIIVLFLFLLNVRTTFISLVTIPISMLVTVITLHLLGQTINTMSLGGMAIAIGSLVDDAIVDVENVFKRLRENRCLPPERRQSVLHVVFEASREVRMPILNSTLIIIVSFIPLFFLTGMEGRMLAPLGIAFITSLCASTLVALTLTPVLCSYLLGGRKAGKGLPDDRDEQKEPLPVRWLKSGYSALLEWSMNHKARLIGITLAIFAGTIVLFSTLGRSFLPAFNEGSFTINVTTVPGISLEESDAIGRRVEKLLLTVPEVQTVGRKTGRAELDEHSQGVNSSEIEAPVVLTDRSKDEVLADIRHKLATVPGVSVEVGAPISHRINAMLSGSNAGIAIKVFGTDLTRMHRLAEEIKEKIQGIEGLTDLNVEQQVERPQLQIVPRRQMLARYGITPAAFARSVRILLEGETVSMVFEGNHTFDLVLKVDSISRESIESIRQMPIDAANGQVALGQVADVTSTTGPNMINRENVARKIVVSANVQGRDLVGVVDDIRRVVDAEVTMPEDYHVEYGGLFESERSASRMLLATSLISILVIYLLLFNQFRSLRQSAIVLINIPLALIGGVVAISITGGIMSIPALIGFIALFGIATRNGMLLIVRYNDLQATGMPLYESVIHGSADRITPILMTALTSALALIPLAVAGEMPGNELQSPMAKVILGGLFTSTFLNAFIIPITYYLTNRKKNHTPCTASSL
ncbi:MAG: efflux RND transporter permease subunit [Alloprevotella sp.]|nr:efflux RND transporter permease subunit [Alloprevotella sp.]